MHAELRLGAGEEVNRKRVERLMRAVGLQGAYRRKGRRNRVNQATEEDLVQRRLHVQAPDRLWLTDITEHPTGEGKDVLRCRHGRLFTTHHRLVHRLTAEHRSGGERISDGCDPAEAGCALHNSPFRSRDANPNTNLEPTP
ncbi:IS3 family transposase [Sphaerisporangium sp. B11E5]|uniref:IS3 family transposase n=1 Tax=Sphaerisporangium sp. B11E5 TaxID=3153563 RepID=UPI00325D7897